MITNTSLIPRVTAWSLALLAGLLLGASAHAQSTKAAPSTARAQLDEPVAVKERPEDRPWISGVSQEQQERAKALYQAGNRYLADAFYAEAVAKYREALQHWSHPGIHYNLALALVSIDRLVEAHESIGEALRYGPDALQPDEYRRARDYQRLLRGQLAQVEVVCQEPGAVVTLDGKALFTGPGEVALMVMPGKHQVVASKARYITTSQAITLAAASDTRVELNLLAELEATVRVRRWPAWTPLLAAGAGLGTGVAAAALHWQSGVNARKVNELAPVYCNQGCDVTPPVLRALQGRAAWQRSAAYAGYATTAALLATGALLTYLNRPQTRENQALQDLVRISLQPGGPGGSRGVTVHISF
jgi:hypothetical protein